MFVLERGTYGLLLPALAALSTSAPVFAQGDRDGWRTLEIETTEVTAPDVAITPDGQSLIFTLLGHLFRMPAEGGEATQLTFGPYFDARPTVSPDGSILAFQSDRDGSEGNVFLLDLRSGAVSQVTFEPWADSPAWAPDGQSLVYLGLDRNEMGQRVASVRRVRIADRRTETLVEGPAELNSPFVLPDGRPGWAAIEWQDSAVAATTHIRVLEPDGTVSTLRAFDGVADALVPGPDAMYVRRYVPRYRLSYVSDDRAVVGIPYDGGPIRRVTDVSVMGVQSPRGEPTFAVSPAGEALYVGEEGRLWRVTPAPGTERRRLPFVATARLEAREPVRPPPWTPPDAYLSSGRLLLRDARVLDLETGRFSEPRSILIEDGRIAWVALEGDRPIPDGTEILDARGRFAIPGLFEMHGHGDWCSHPDYLGHGITSMRNLGAELDHLRLYRDAGPGSATNCFFAGQLISGWDFLAHARPADETGARSLVRRMRDEGATLIKLHFTLPWPLARAAADEAWMLGLPVVRHVDVAEEIIKAVIVGAHPTHSPGPYEDLHSLLSASVSRVDVTLQTMSVAAAARAFRRGVKIFPGTDFAPVPRGRDPAGPDAFHGALAALNEAGIPPIEILLMATLTAAEAVGAEAHLGSLEARKVADIVLLDADPLEDIGNTRRIWRVIRGGRIIHPGRPESVHFGDDRPLVVPQIGRIHWNEFN